MSLEAEPCSGNTGETRSSLGDRTMRHLDALPRIHDVFEIPDVREVAFPRSLFCMDDEGKNNMEIPTAAGVGSLA